MGRVLQALTEGGLHSSKGRSEPRWPMLTILDASSQHIRHGPPFIIYIDRNSPTERSSIDYRAQQAPHACLFYLLFSPELLHQFMKVREDGQSQLSQSIG